MPISSVPHKALNFGPLACRKKLSGESGRLNGGENSPRQADRSHSWRFSFAQQDARLGHLALPLAGDAGKFQLNKVNKPEKKDSATCKP
jgi:hypothetical protein